MEQLTVLRQKIDEIDQEIQRLFISRMETVRAIAEFKIANDLSVYDRNRETAVIDANVSRIAASEYADYYRTVLECVMQVSKEYQKAIVRSSL
ncbi:MAG: chorismate mutase [bacterium]